MSAEHPAVSVVVLTWNREWLLRETVDAILAQTHPDLEVLIVDNESEDGTERWATSHPDLRVRYVRHANGGNISVNRNHALGLVRGRFVAFCDDDDLWLPDKLERQMTALEARPEFSLCCTDVLLFSDEGEIGRYVRKRPTGEIRFPDLLTGWHDVLISTVVARRELFERTGTFNEDPALFSVEDYEYWLRAAKGHRLWYLDEGLVRYRVHAGMASHRDMRLVIDKQARVFASLAAAGVISAEEESEALRNLSRNRRAAAVKEALKRVPFAMRAWYALRRAVFALAGGRRQR